MRTPTTTPGDLTHGSLGASVPPLYVVTDGLGHCIGPMPEPVARRIVERNAARGRRLKVVKWA